MFVRLENLSSFERIDKSSETGYSKLVFQRTGLLAHILLDIQSSVASRFKAGDTIFVFPENFKPKEFNISLLISFPTGRPLRVAYEETTGRIYALAPLDLNESLYLNLTYVLRV